MINYPSLVQSCGLCPKKTTEYPLQRDYCRRMRLSNIPTEYTPRRRELTEYSTSSQADSTEYPSPKETSTRALYQCKWCLVKTEKAAKDYSPREFGQVFAILEPYWHIFNLVLEYEPRNCVDHHVTPPMKPGMPTIICETECLSANGKYMQAYGSFVHAPWVSVALKRGSNKFNHCDFSIRLFLCILEPRLSNVGATIIWLAVEVKPRWVIHWRGYRPDPLVRHSVFSITTQSGDEYIADFTIEQFGFGSDYWIMCRTDYEELCTTGRARRQPRPGEVEAALRGEINDWDEKAEVVRKVCHQMHYYRLEAMDRVSMIQRLEILVKNACWYMWHDEPAYRRLFQ